MRRNSDKRYSSVLLRSQERFQVFWPLVSHTWMVLETLRDGGEFVHWSKELWLILSRWIFILEGILTVFVAILAYFTLYDFPETAGFLTEEERAFVVYRLKYQGASNTTINGVRVAQDDTFQWKFVKAAFLDWQIWTNIWVYWGM
jgi:hypothetical protein